jgi:hypothetical protein
MGKEKGRKSGRSRGERKVKEEVKGWETYGEVIRKLALFVNSWIYHSPLVFLTTAYSLLEFGICRDNKSHMGDGFRWHLVSGQ